MADREKVIDGLCGAIGLIHGYIPKSLWADGYEEQACRDAIALLKEQEVVIPKRMHHNERASFDNYLCECKNDLYYKQKFCDECGRAVKWDA